VKLEAVGTALRGYVDGALKVSATDASHATGKVRLRDLQRRRRVRRSDRHAVVDGEHDGHEPLRATGLAAALPVFPRERQSCIAGADVRQTVQSHGVGGGGDADVDDVGGRFGGGQGLEVEAGTPDDLCPELAATEAAVADGWGRGRGGRGDLEGPVFDVVRARRAGARVLRIEILDPAGQLQQTKDIRRKAPAATAWPTRSPSSWSSTSVVPTRRRCRPSTRPSSPCCAWVRVPARRLAGRLRA